VEERRTRQRRKSYSNPDRGGNWIPAETSAKKTPGKWVGNALGGGKSGRALGYREKRVFQGGSVGPKREETNSHARKEEAK